MASWFDSQSILNGNIPGVAALAEAKSYAEAEAVLQDLANVFLENTSLLASELTRPC